MKLSSFTSPLRGVSEALNPNNVANKLVETGYRVGGIGGATVAGAIGAVGSTAAALEVAAAMNPLETARATMAEVTATSSWGGKVGAAMGGAAEVAVQLVAPVVMLTFAFESLDATAQAWDKPRHRIRIDD